MRNWNNLSPAYRARLQQAGITKGDYESGAPLAKARGHAKTPEHPQRAETPNNRQKYKEYLQRRAALENQVIAKKQELFGNSPKFNASRSADKVKNQPMSLMRRFLDEGLGLFDDPDYDDIKDSCILCYH